MVLCRRIGSLLSAYLDGELDAEQAASVQAHLDRCAHCRTEFQALQETKLVLAALGQRTPRADLERLLQADVGEVARRVANYPISPRTFAAVILTLVGVWAATLQLDRYDDRHGPPLPEGAYHPFVEGRWVRVTGAVVTGPGTVTLLLDDSPAPRPSMPASLSFPTPAAPDGIVQAGFLAAPVSLHPAHFRRTSYPFERR